MSRIPFLLILLLISLQGATAFAQTTPAQNKDVLEQTDRERTQLVPNTYTFSTPKREKPFTFDNFLKNLHGSYYVSLMGPRLVGASNETYNVYLEDIAPIGLFHAWQLGYQVSDDLQMGVSDSAVQSISDGVIGRNGFVRNQSFELYDPNIFFNLPNLIQIPSLRVSTNIAVSLSVTKASQDIGKVTAITISQNWNIAQPPTGWTIGFTTYLKPQFYTDPIPAGYTDRQTLVFAFGHYLAYAISPVFSLQTSSTFDFEHREPDPEGSLHMGSNLPDRYRISCSITPQTAPLLLSFGGYFQFLAWKPEAETSIFGADFSIGF